MPEYCVGYRDAPPWNRNVSQVVHIVVDMTRDDATTPDRTTAWITDAPSRRAIRRGDRPMRTERPTTRRTEVMRPAGAPAGDRPTPAEAWLLGLGLAVTEVERCPVPDCEVCIAALPDAA